MINVKSWKWSWREFKMVPKTWTDDTVYEVTVWRVNPDTGKIEGKGKTWTDSCLMNAVWGLVPEDGYTYMITIKNVGT